MTKKLARIDPQYTLRRLVMRASLGTPQGWRFELEPGSIESGQMRAAFTTNF